MTGARLAHFAPASLIARRFVEARLAGTALSEFPGPIPSSLALAYACQNLAIDLWPDKLAGWKVGRVAPDLHKVLGQERLAGAIFAQKVWPARPGQMVEFPVFVGGFAAVEGEFIYRLAADAPPDKTEWTPGEALALVAAMHVGIETAGSPLAQINDLGPTVVAADFGNNNGLILGPALPDWRALADVDLKCDTFINARQVGSGDASLLPGGTSAALAFILSQCAQIGRPLKAGALISSGAVTGVHDIVTGQTARVDFGRWGGVECLAVAAKPMTELISDQGVSR